jgi:hypothetical protein
MKFLILLFKKCGINVTESIFKLLKKENFNYVVKKFSNGKFSYFGIKDNLEYIVKNNLTDKLEIADQLQVSFNIDGLPLFKSSRVSATPILMKIYGLDR